MLIVTTKEELKKAIKNKEKSFEIDGDLAKKIKTASVIKKLSGGSLIVIAAIVGALGVTSVTPAAPIVLPATYALTFATGAEVGAGVSSGLIATIASLGGIGCITMLTSLFKGYELEFEAGIGDCYIRANCTRKK